MSYMKVGKILISSILTIVIIGTILAPISPVFAQSTAQFDTSTLEKSGIRDELSCSFTNIDVGNCIAIALYFFAYTIPAGILGLTANFFNATIGLTLSSKLYYLSSFIEDGWSLVRDIANIFFIFILLFVALQTILGFGASTKKTIAKLIMVAILINFSMFFVKVIIDTSNILALVFYNRITITANDADKNPAPYNQVVDKSLTNIDEKDVAGAFVSAFNPQVLTDPDYISIFQDTAQYSYVDPTTNQTVSYEKKNMNVTKIMIILIFTGIIFLYASWCFFIAGVSLFGRLIGLWLSIILAPIACVTYIMPSLQSQFKQIGWKEWWTNLMTLAFNAPIFMFFIYLIILLSKSDLISSINLLRNPDQDFIVILLLIAIPMLIIMGFLQMATDFAKKMGGQIGEGFVKFAENAYKNVGGFAVGAATMGVGIGLQSTVGANAQKKLADKDLQDRANSGDASAQRELRRAEYLATRSFDLRDTAIGKFGAKKLKIDTGATKGLEQFLATPGITGSQPIDLSTKGGAMGRTERAKKFESTEVNRTKITRDPEVRAQNDAAKSWQSEYEKHRDAAREDAENKNLPFSEKEFKEMYEAGIAKSVDKQGQVITVGSAKVSDSKEVNAQRMRDRADTLQYGTGYLEALEAAKKAVAKKRAEEIAAGKAEKDRTKKFDEKEWRYNGIKDASGTTIAEAHFTPANREPGMTRQTEEIVAELRKNAGEETKDRELGKKERVKLEKELKTADDELSEIKKLLEEARVGNGLATIDDVTQAHVDSTLTLKEVEFDQANAQIEHEYENSIKIGNPASPAYIQNKLKQKKLRAEIDDLKKIFKEKQKFETQRNELVDKLGI